LLRFSVYLDRLFKSDTRSRKLDYNYYVLKSFLTEEEIQYVKINNIINNKDKFKSVIQSCNVNVQDNKRLMLEHPIKSQLQKFGLSYIDNKVLNFCNTEFNGLKKSDASILLSLNGCMEQQIHTDYDTNSKNSYKSRILIIAIMDNTSIIVWNKRGYNKRIIKIPKGSMFIGRGTLLHAGNSYDIINLRLHYYVDYEDEGIMTSKDNKNFTRTYLHYWNYDEFHESLLNRAKNLGELKKEKKRKDEEKKENCRKRMKLLNEKRENKKM
jgi:hypothetical protein